MTDVRDSTEESRQKLWWKEENVNMACRYRMWLNGVLGNVLNKNRDSKKGKGYRGNYV